MTDPTIPPPLTSYAQNFEDVILWRALKQVKEGFYIDVGAQDPVHNYDSDHVQMTKRSARLNYETPPRFAR